MKQQKKSTKKNQPKLKLSNQAKILTSYFLMGLVALIISFVLIAFAKGYDYNPKTGEVIKNGLVLVDSSVEDSEVLVNGKLETEKSPKRLALPAGAYKIEIRKAGYQSWSRSIDVKGGEVYWLHYPRLVPENPTIEPLVAVPGIKQYYYSSDKELVSIVANPKKPILRSFSLTETSPAIAQEISLAVTIPKVEAAEEAKKASWQYRLEEVSKDEQSFLVRRSKSQTVEFLLINRETSAVRLVNSLSDVRIKKVSFASADGNLIAVLGQNGNLRRLNQNGELSGVLESDVVDFKVSSADFNTLVAVKSADRDRSLVKIEGTDKVSLGAAPTQLEFGFFKFGDVDYFYHLDKSSGRLKLLKGIYGYKNSPLESEYIIYGTVSKPIDIKESQSGQFLTVGNGEQFTTIDLERDKLHAYQPQKIGKVVNFGWLDTHIQYAIDNKNNLEIVDYDGSNQVLIADKVFSGGSVLLNNETDQLWFFRRVNSSKPNLLSKIELINSKTRQ